MKQALQTFNTSKRSHEIPQTLLHLTSVSWMSPRRGSHHQNALKGSEGIEKKERKQNTRAVFSVWSALRPRVLSSATLAPSS